MIKHLLLITAVIASISFATAQPYCAQSIDSRTFGNNLQQMRIIPNDAIRINRALQFVQVYCLNSAQLFDLAQLFSDDNFL